MPIPPILDAAHALAARGLGAGELAVDATVGNGHDTLFLVREVGEGGRVVGFDVQADALQATRERVRSEAPEAAGRLRLIRGGHEQMLEHIGEEEAGSVGAVMFNLGYLPGGDHSITTEPGTTLEALGAALELLRPGGIVTVVAYPGHEGGAVETEAVAEWGSALPQGAFRVLSYHFVNQANDAPRLFAVEKRLKSG
ncbi:MAG: class I SAM-dependent methyltransferase [Salinibacter sp.]